MTAEMCGTWIRTGCEREITCERCCCCERHCACVRIAGAAVRHGGRVYVGLRHGLIMQEIWEACPGAKISQEDQGFLTNDGRFLNRFQAGAVAFMAGQTKTRKQHLLSEDLW